MIENADEVVNCIAEKIREILRTKEYGTFGITITMHEGAAVENMRAERNQSAPQTGKSRDNIKIKKA